MNAPADPPTAATPSPPEAPAPHPPHAHARAGDNAAESDNIVFTMKKQWVWAAIVALLGSTGLGGGVVSAVSDSKMDSRVEAVLNTKLDARLDQKLDAKLDARLQASAAAADKASASSARASEDISKLTELFIRQGAEQTAQARVDAQARQTLEQRIIDHEARLRDLERSRQR